MKQLTPWQTHSHIPPTSVLQKDTKYMTFNDYWSVVETITWNVICLIQPPHCLVTLYSRILPLHNTDARLAEGIPQCQEEERACRPRVASCSHQLLQLLLLFSLQGFLIHDVGWQWRAAAVCHCGFRRVFVQSLLWIRSSIPKDLRKCGIPVGEICPLVRNPSQSSLTVSVADGLIELPLVSGMAAVPSACKGLVYWAAVWSRE